MKRILFLVCLLVAVAGCSQQKDIDLNTYDGKGLEFIHFASSSDSWLIQESDPSFVKNVVVACTYKYDKDVTYNVSLGENTTGIEGTDFKIATKSVTIPAGEYSGELPVEILYETTGEGFKLELVLDVDGSKINPAYGNASAIVIKTDKVTIDWDWLAGKWDAQDYCYYSGGNDGDQYSVNISKVDENTCTISNLWGTGGNLSGVVDFENRTVTIVGYQYLMHLEQYLTDLYFIAVDPATDYDIYDPIDTPVVATLSPAGIVIDNWDLLMVGGPYDGYTFNGGEKTTLTKP